MTARTETDTIKIVVDSIAPIYLHVDRSGNEPPVFAVSVPGKFKESGIGNLLERLVAEINDALAGAGRG